MADKDDDFDEWLVDIDSDDSELDQSNIDDLLSSVATEDNDIDDQAPGELTGGELDQDNIDALLGLTSTPTDSPDTSSEDVEIDELDQDNIDALLSGTGYDPDAGDDFSLDELDQNNIDALLAGESDSDLSGDDDNIAELAQDNLDALLADSAKTDDSEDGSQVELDQNNIDDLLTSAPEGEKPDELLATDDTEAEASSATEESDDLGDFDQDNIDSLFDDINADSADDAETPPAPEDTNLDELFAGEDDEPETLAEAAPEKLSAAEEESEAPSAFDSELDEMDQLFADLDSDIEEDDPFQDEEIDFAEMLGESDGDDQEFIELDAADTSDADADEFIAQEAAQEGQANDVDAISRDDEKKEKKSRGVMIPAALAGMNKSVLTGLGSGVAILLLVGLYFLFSASDKTMEPTQEASAPVQQAPVQKMVENFIPVTEDALYDMGSEGGELSIALMAVDKDDQPLIYDITTPPLHGRLSGTAPLLTYLPDNTFPGEDRFEFTVSDGTDASNLAVVTITGPDLATLAMQKQEAEKKKKATKKIFKPKKPKVLAQDATYSTVSTGPVTIDWARLWQKANSSAYAPQAVHVEIVDTMIKGSLKKQGRDSHIFSPDPYSASLNTIHYRFKKGGFRSATKTVSINVKLGSPAPEINIAELAKGYKVGQNVVIDASTSRDEARESLKFIWKQKGGVKIDLRPTNAEGSKVAFTMPSSFYSDPNSGPTISVTAVDNTGKEVHKEIKVIRVSRRQTALWRGENGSVAPEPPMEGRYFPWPFDD